MARYDYVVLGGGSAGALIAGRLSEDRSRSVCLIEAGPPDNDPRVRVPLGLLRLMGHARFDWRYHSEPHPHLGDRRVAVPRGRVLGGSGSINSMVYIRGRSRDYDAWAAQGCTGWGWKHVLPRFVRAENNERLGDTPLHGDSGPLFVQNLRSPHPMVDEFIAAGYDLGIPPNDDFNGRRQEGLGHYQATMRRGRRWSSVDAYLRPARRRSNLTVFTGTLVDRVAFNGRRAHRVHLLSDEGYPWTVDVGRELIVCAGSIGSPAILLRSGIGPGAELQRHGIPVVHALAGVGENLHDHPAVGIHYAGGDQGYALSRETLARNVLAPLHYLLARRGVFSSNTVEGGGFARTGDDLAEPDVQFHFIPAPVPHGGTGLARGRGYYGDVCLLKPRSRGRVTLHSTDPGRAPAIDLNLLSDAQDRATLLRGVRLVRRLLSHPRLKRGDAREVLPGPQVSTDEQLVEFIAQRVGTAYHPVGTCRMGAATDPGAVVDPQLRVYGLENVRVADASVMPEIVAGNTNAPTMMIADAAADDVLATPV